MKFKTSDDVELYYEVHGDGEPILFLSGLFSDSKSWLYQIPVFSKKYTCIILDHRGQGQSEKWHGEYSYTRHAKDAFELINHLGIKKTHVVGMSHGGMVTPHLACNYPDHIKSCTLSSCQLFPSVYLKLILEGWLFALNNGGFETMYRNVVQYALGHIFLEKNYNMIDDIVSTAIKRNEKEAAIALVKAVYNYGDLRDTIKNINTPALILAGKLDVLTPPQVIEETHKVWNNSRFHIFEKSGHSVNIEANEEYNNIVMSFIKENL